MTLRACDIAEEVRRILPEAKPGRVQRLVYLAQKCHLRSHGVPLYGDQIEAWSCGPVVVSLWRAQRYRRSQPAANALPAAAKETVAAVCERYGHRSELSLQALAQRDEAWVRAWTHRPLGALAVAMSAEDLMANDAGEHADADPEPGDGGGLRLDDPRVLVGGLAQCNLQEREGMEPPVSRRRRLVTTGR